MIYAALLIFIGGLFIGGWLTLRTCDQLAKKRRALLQSLLNKGGEEKGNE